MQIHVDETRLDCNYPQFKRDKISSSGVCVISLLKAHEFSTFLRFLNLSLLSFYRYYCYISSFYTCDVTFRVQSDLQYTALIRSLSFSIKVIFHVQCMSFMLILRSHLLLFVAIILSHFSFRYFVWDEWHDLTDLNFLGGVSMSPKFLVAWIFYTFSPYLPALCGETKYITFPPFCGPNQCPLCQRSDLKCTGNEYGLKGILSFLIGLDFTPLRN